MKLREAVRNLLIFELGDSTNPYDYRVTEIVPKKYKYIKRFEFESDAGHQYEIKFEAVNDRHGTITVDFRVKGQPIKAVTNEGNPYRVMATVIAAARKVWKNKDEIEDAFDNPNIASYPVLGFFFTPIGTDFKKVEQREKLYKAFIRSQFPNAEINKNNYGIEVIP